MRATVDKSLLESSLEAQSNDYFRLYAALKNWAMSIWDGHTDVFEQVSHDISHSEKLLAFADILLQEQVNVGNLNEKELFLLLSAIYLHDVGMQFGWKVHTGVTGTRGNLSPEERNIIRRQHAQTTGAVIRDFKTELPRTLNADLNEKEKAILLDDLNEHLAFVCESHNQNNIAIYLDTNIHNKFGNTQIEIDLICATLQLCDALHMDKGRLNVTLFLDSLDRCQKNLPCEAQYSDADWKRFFQCYYIEEVQLNRIASHNSIFKLNVSYKFNKNERQEIKDKCLNVYADRLERRSHDCVTVLNRFNIHFLNDDKFEEIEPDTSKQLFPPNLDYIFDSTRPESTLLALPDAPPLLSPPVDVSSFGSGDGFDINYYIHSPREEPRVINRLLDGRPALIWGCNKAGKTWFIQGVLAEIRQQGLPFDIFELPLVLMDKNCIDLELFNKWIVRRLCIALGIGIDDLEDSWNPMGHGAAEVLESYLAEHVFPRLQRPLLFVLDQAECLIPFPFANDFFKILATWFEHTDTGPGKQMRLLMSLNVRPSNIIDIANISNLITTDHTYLDGMDKARLTELTFKFGLSLDEHEISLLHKWFGGHPWITGKALEHISRHKMSLSNFLDAEVHNIFNFFLIKNGRELKQCGLYDTYAFVKQGRCKRSKIPPEHFKMLHQSGLIKVIGNEIEIACELFQHI